MLLVFTSLALLATSTAVQASGSVNPNLKQMAGGVQLCGAILAPAAVLVMIYAMWRYYWRISRITRPDENARFEDTVGPLILVGALRRRCPPSQPQGVEGMPRPPGFPARPAPF